MSIERSKKDSSREDTVSHVRHRVSLVSVPSKSRCTSVLLKFRDCELKTEVALGGGTVLEASDVTDVDTDHRHRDSMVNQVKNWNHRDGRTIFPRWACPR